MRPMQELKMAEKRAERLEKKRGYNAERHDRRKAYLKQTGNDRMLANISRFHPDYGMTVAQHEAQKELRKAGKVPFVDKAGLAVRRGALAKGYGL